MTLALRQRDLLVLLGLAGATAFAVSLGLDAGLAVELAVAAALLQLVAVLLRASPEEEPVQQAGDDEDALAVALRTVDSATTGPWGVQGRFRRVVRDAVAARRSGLDRGPDDLPADLPPVLVTLLVGRWEHDRGLTRAELHQVLTAVEELERD